MHGSIDTSSALASGVPLVIRQAAFIPQGRSERRVMTCLGRRRDGGQRDIELWEAPLSKRKSQSCCGRRPDHDGTLGFDKGAREPRIHTTRSAVNRPHTICQKIWHLIGAGPRGETESRDVASNFAGQHRLAFLTPPHAGGALLRTFSAQHETLAH